MSLHSPPTPSVPNNSMSVDEWSAVLGESSAITDKSRLNSLVMNWLIVSGFQSVAEQFQQETETPAAVPLSSISARTAVRQSLSSGSIDQALQQIEALAPTLLESNPSLFLALKQQKLVELIRTNQIESALTYARTHLKDGCKDEAEFLSQMESIMSLLAFSALPPEHNPMKHLLDQSARNQLGNQVNEKILEAQFACKESQLGIIIKQLQHAQDTLKTFMPQFPILDCSAAESTAQSAQATSATLPPLLDPTRTFETLAAAEAVARREAEERAAVERANLAAAVEAETRAKRERDEARRIRRAEAAAARAREPRSQYRQDIPTPAEEEDEEEEEDDEDEEDPNEDDDSDQPMT